MSEEDFRYKHRDIPEKHMESACQLVGKAEGKTDGFYALDTKNCSKGNENLRERLVTLSQNRTSLSDEFASRHEKILCSEFKSYVNLCKYVDGELNDIQPQDVSLLPVVNLSKKPSQICTPQPAKPEDGIFTMEYDFANLSKDLNSNIHVQMINGYKSRMIASKTKTFVLCDQVRNSFSNLGCARFESVQSGLATFSKEASKNIKPADIEQEALPGNK